MGARRDYYEVLGVSRTASTDELKRAYKKLAVKLHPDHNPEDRSAEEAFKEASEAYAVLGDVERRRRYDRQGHGAFGDAGASGFPPPDMGSIGEMLEGLFGEVFGRRGESSLPRDLRYELDGPNLVVLRFLGVSNYELAYKDNVILLDLPDYGTLDRLEADESVRAFGHRAGEWIFARHHSMFLRERMGPDFEFHG